jgi:hypothetical protein
LGQIQKRLTGLQLTIAVLAFILAVILIVDVSSALRSGEYLSRQESLARYVGQWFTLFTIRGVPINSQPVLTLFFVWAGLLVIMAAFYLWQPNRTWGPMILLALLSFWYFPLGSWFGVTIIVLLAWSRVQKR